MPFAIFRNAKPCKRRKTRLSCRAFAKITSASGGAFSPSQMSFPLASATSFVQTAVVLLTTLSKCSTIKRQTKLGVMAQLVARLNGIQKVRGSNPLSSTNRGGLLVVATKKGKAKAPFLFYCSLLLRRLMAPLR